jgi:hypothetical protein
VIDLLLKHGVENDLTRTDRFLAAAAVGDQVAAQAMLAEDPSLVSSLSSDDKVAIVDAARCGRSEAVSLMVDSGFDVAVKDNEGFTPLHWAAWYGHTDTVRVLLEKGAPLESKNNYGGTVLDATVWGLANSDARRDGATEVLGLLLDHGADIEAVEPFPSGHDDIDRWLRARGKQ